MSVMELRADMWELVADAYCIPNNGTVRFQRAIMGAGVAKAALARYPGLDTSLALEIALHGHITQVIPHFTMNPPRTLVSFPTKYNWWQPSPPSLVAKSAIELMDLIEGEGWEAVVLPRPGCGRGGLEWVHQVRPILDDILDDRVLVVDW